MKALLLGIMVILRPAYASDWKIDKEMKFNFAFLPPKILETEKASALPLLKNFPFYAPDITNIIYKNLLDLGFPLPPIEHPEKSRFLIKLYDYPRELNGEASAKRALDPFYIDLISGGKEILRYTENSKNLAVKFIAVDDIDHDLYSSGSPLPIFSLAKGSRQEKQNYFDGSIPYTSIYIGPAKQSRWSSEKERARASAQGVVFFHGQILETYRQLMIEILPSEKNYRFIETKSCLNNFDEICSLKLIEIAKNPMVFESYRNLPMPQDPNRVFLSGLLLLKVSEYSIHEKITMIKENFTKILSSGVVTHSQMLEVASILDLRKKY